jgi:hypothetical protein
MLGARSLGFVCMRAQAMWLHTLRDATRSTLPTSTYLSMVSM